MSEQTKIQWATHTFNPWIGCTKVSPGCAHCYAEKETLVRVKRANGIELWGKGKDRHRTSVATWNTIIRLDSKAAKATERPRVFPSMCDPFDEEVSDDLRDEFFDVVALCVNMDWLLLTKRPAQAHRYLTALYTHKRQVFDAAVYRMGYGAMALFAFGKMFEKKPFSNLWIGTSVEDQQRAEERIPELLKIPAKVRFLSVEPLLGPVDLAHWLIEGGGGGIDWVIAGGESGPKARPCNVGWIRSVVEQCKAAGVPCFVKQLGAVAISDDLNPDQIHFKHPKGGEPSEWPADLRVREFPSRKAEMAEP